MSAQIIVSPTGERMVVLPENEYRSLVDAAEDAADREVVRRFRQALEAGEEELVPAAMVERLLGGENPVRVWREHRGLSARDLATASGMSATYLSEIETGRKQGSVAALRKIAEALRVDLDDLV